MIINLYVVDVDISQEGNATAGTFRETQ